MKSLKITSLFTVSLTASFIIFMGVIAASGAWVEPQSAPPGGNVSAPINIGGDGQAKVGGLAVNVGGAPVGLGVLGGGSLDLSGIIRIVDSSGTLVDEGDPGDILTRGETSIEWETPSNLPTCVLLAESGIQEKIVKTVPVPENCIGQSCTLALITTAPDFTGTIVADLHGTTYMQINSKPAGGFFWDFAPSLGWWVRPGIGADGVDCESQGRGQNGTTKGCDRIVQDGPNLVVYDDYPGTEVNSYSWTFRDNKNDFGMTLLLCD
jgi:hypothetical protein